jgi:lysylphosphatidylglycerol synthetase-like protein (DUF2156 family)
MLLAITRSSDAVLSLELALGLVFLVLARPAFKGPPEGTSHEHDDVGAGWIFAVGAALLVSLWIGLFSGRSAAVEGETWWQFTLFGGAPAHVRAAVGAGVALLLAVLVAVMHRSARAPRA